MDEPRDASDVSEAGQGHALAAGWPQYLLAGAVVIGLLLALLTYGQQVGFGFALAGLVVVAGTLALGRQCRVRPSRSGLALLGFLAFLSVMLGVRASPALSAANLLAALGLLLLLAVLYVPGRLAHFSLSDYVQAALVGSVAAVGQPFAILANDLRASRRAVAERSRLLPIFWGLVVAVPLLVAFGALFYSADAVFAGYVRQLFGSLRLADVLGRLVWWFILGWPALGLLGYAFTRPRPATGASPALTRPAGLRTGSSETVVILVLLNALFAAFVGIQAVYLFGGADTLAQSGMTYSEYARRGFFELVAVAGMVLSLVLFLHWLARPGSRRALRAVHGLHILLIALTLVILLSAALRMRLYQSEYGLTELRFYTSAFMGWLAVVLAWLVAVVLARGSQEASDAGRRRFAFGALVAALALLAGLNLLNPDAFIARTNLARAAAGTGQPLDTEYLTEALSADAVPTLVNGLAGVPNDRCLRHDLAYGLQEKSLPLREAFERHGWLGTTWGQEQARRALVAANASLSADARQGCTPTE